MTALREPYDQSAMSSGHLAVTSPGQRTDALPARCGRQGIGPSPSEPLWPRSLPGHLISRRSPCHGFLRSGPPRRPPKCAPPWCRPEHGEGHGRQPGLGQRRARPVRRAERVRDHGPGPGTAGDRHRGVQQLHLLPLGPHLHRGAHRHGRRRGTGACLPRRVRRPARRRTSGLVRRHHPRLRPPRRDATQGCPGRGRHRRRDRRGSGQWR